MMLAAPPLRRRRCSAAREAPERAAILDERRRRPAPRWLAGLALVGCSGAPAAPAVSPAVPAVSPAVPAAPAASSVSPIAPPGAPGAPWPGLNLGFEQLAGGAPAGWASRSSYEATAVTDVRHGGAQSLRLRSSGASPFGSVVARVPADPVRGMRLELHGWIKTADVRGLAGMFLRVEGAVDAVDDMPWSRRTGTEDWTEITAALDVPDHGQTIAFGPMLIGEGTAWFDDLRLEVIPRPRPRPIVLAGTVVDPAGAPVAGATVSLVSATGVADHAASDAGGRFHFGAMSGSWGLSAHHRGHVGSFLDAAPLDGDTRNLRLVLGGSGGGVLVHGTVGPGKPAPGAYVQIGIASTHSGDSFAVPVAADGTFEATLPRGPSYSGLLLGGPGGRVSAATAGDRAELAIPLASYAPPPPAVVDWIAAHAIPVATTEPGRGLGDLAAVGRLVGEARVVALGEATHGSREIFQLKHRLLEYLVATQGFTVFAIEADQPECRAINDYVLRGAGDARTALDGTHKWPWSTEEVLAMIEWMRAWNADPEHSRKVQFVGFDMLTSRVAYASVAGFLTRVAPDQALGLLAPVATLGGEMVIASAAVAALTDDGVGRLRVGLAALAQAFDAHRAAWARAAGGAALDEARHDVEILEQAARRYIDARAGKGDFALRSRSMAANIQWILAHQPAGTRVVVWAHNGHVATAPAGAGPERASMGTYLREALGAGYVNLGFVFSQGAFQAEILGGARAGVGEVVLGPPPDTDASVPFARTGRPILILDLRAVPPRGPVHDWFAAPHPVRQVGVFFSTERGATEEVTLLGRHDAVIFVDRTTRARPVHLPY